ncbi:PQQ-like beta-propeller repeat protein [Candidatus Pelagibacter sp.]|nr:PQQ-like beta-propeller repeat protein [Candidatus Pelagibacter sp.]
MSNLLRIILVFLFVNNCSAPLLKKEPEIKEQKNITEVLKKEQNINIEFNPNLEIKLQSKTKNKSFLNNLKNNNGRTSFNGNLEVTKKFKFSKIENFNEYDPEVTFYNDNLVFFDKKGTILMFDNNAELIWKKNNYTKPEKKQNPILFFANNNKYLVVADNIAKYYTIDINTGEVLWSKKNIAPFNSQLKIYNDKFFIVDLQNILRAYSIKSGNEIWNIKTKNPLIRSQKKVSIVIVEDDIFFNNSSGDISAVNIDTGELLWQRPTQSSFIFDDGYPLKTSDIIAHNEALYFSTNKNQFFSLDIKTGIVNWKQKINSDIRPTLVGNFIFTVSIEGYLVVIEKSSGNIIRITDAFKNFKKKNRNKIKPTGFIVGKNNIYLTTNHGRLLVMDIKTAKIINIIKIDANKISRPLTLNKKLFIIRDNSILKLN